jgi:hypothetical protein
MPGLTSCVAVFFLLLLPSLAAAQTSPRVWAINDGEKVEQDERAHPGKARNSAWDGRRIKLFAARNEIVAFQLIVEGGSKGIEKLSVSLRELTHRDGKVRITYNPPAADPTNYVGRPIQLFSENYLRVTEPTRASWIYRLGTPSAPKDPTGLKPVQLVPENAKPGRGGFPLRVAPMMNQAVWVEIYTARDLPAGTYAGAVAVSADGKTTTLPVELELFDFALPDENSMHAMVYYERAQPELYQGRVRCRRGVGGDGPFRRRRFHEGEKLRGAGRGRRKQDRARVVLRAGPRLRRAPERVAQVGRVDDLSQTTLARRDHIPLHARRAAPVTVRAHPADRRQRPFKSGAGRQAADPRHAPLGRRACGRD